LAHLLQRRPRAALFKQALIPRWTTAVLRRTVARVSGANRVRLTRITRQHLFQADVMLPEVAHVIFVDEAFARSELEIGQADLVGIVVKEYAALAVDAIFLAMDPKPMQM